MTIGMHHAEAYEPTTERDSPPVRFSKKVGDEEEGNGKQNTSCEIEK